jgi:hypothetical protein
MKIAISGTHCVGKSTLIDAFLLAHPDFAHEPEPYEALEEDYGESFAAEPTAEDFRRQLEYNIERLEQYGPDDRVIYERCPVDYLAYMFAVADLGRVREASGVLENALVMAREAMRHLDIIVFLSADGISIDVPEAEDLELRSAVDARLESILLTDELGLFKSGHPLILEASGPTPHRLQTLQKALGEPEVYS